MYFDNQLWYAFICSVNYVCATVYTGSCLSYTDSAFSYLLVLVHAVVAAIVQQKQTDEQILGLIRASATSRTTRQYDQFQHLQNNICM
jgi:hypothetical protein